MALRRGVCGALGCEASEKLRRREVRDGRVAMGVVLCPWRSMSVSRGGVEDAWAWRVGRVNRTLGPLVRGAWVILRDTRGDGAWGLGAGGWGLGQLGTYGV